MKPPLYNYSVAREAYSYDYIIAQNFYTVCKCNYITFLQSIHQCVNEKKAYVFHL